MISVISTLSAYIILHQDRPESHVESWSTLELYDTVSFTWTFMGGWMYWFSLRCDVGTHTHTHTQTALQLCYDDIQSTILNQSNLWLTWHPFNH